MGQETHTSPWDGLPGNTPAYREDWNLELASVSPVLLICPRVQCLSSVMLEEGKEKQAGGSSGGPRPKPCWWPSTPHFRPEA